MEDKIIVGIVTFNPDLDRLNLSIDILLHQKIDSILIVDNGSDNIKCIESTIKEKTMIIKNKKNKGIAYALNIIGKVALDKNYKYFLTLDQDSLIDDNFIKNAKKIIFDNSFSNIGLFCPYVDRYGDYIKSEKQEIVKSAISSGSLVKTSVWNEIGGFWEFLFIDEVDHEFCYRLREKGYQIMKIYSCCINHIIGNPNKNEKIILWHKFYPTNHNSFRRYYMTRNSIIMLYLYPKEKEPFPHRIIMMFRIFVSITFCEKDKLKKYKAMLFGIVDALKWIVMEGKMEK